MSGTLPTDAFQKMTVTTFAGTREHIAQSGKIQAQGTGVQRFSIKGSLAPTKREAAEVLFSFVMQQEGRANTFDVIPPIEGYTQGNTTSKVTVNGAHSKGVETISIQGADAPIAHGFIKFANHSKVYRVVQPSETSIEIRPRLMKPLLDNELVIYNAVPFRVSFVSDIHDMDMSDANWYRQKLEMKEAF
ncbi:MAG: hypothetical protein AAF542_17825 [Pseudomonadota bacterium]